MMKGLQHFPIMHRAHANLVVPIFLVMIVPMKQRNGVDNQNNFTFCKFIWADHSTKLRWVKRMIRMIISMIPLFHWNNENKKIFESLNLLWPLKSFRHFSAKLKHVWRLGDLKASLRIHMYRRKINLYNVI